MDGCTWLVEAQLNKLLKSRGVDVDDDSEAEAPKDTMMRKKRQVDRYVIGSGQFRKWPMPVPFKFDGDHSEFR